MQRCESGTGRGCVAHAQLLNLQKKKRFPPMSLKKQNEHNLTVKTDRGLSNIRIERNRVSVRGTVIVISAVVTYLFSSSLF